MVIKLGQLFFKFRDVLPIPLAIGMLLKAKPKRIWWILGLPQIILGEGIRLWALMHIGPTTRTREVCADKLIETGPYSVTRNPLYLANLIKVSGILTVSGDPLVFLEITLFYLLEFFSIISFEESFLRQKFPGEFENYSKKVPTFFPASLKCNGEASFSFSEAFVSEYRTFASTGLILLMLAIKSAGNVFSEEIRA